MRWLAEWVKKDYVEPGIARCMEPPSMREKLLLTTQATAFQCKSKYFVSVLTRVANNKKFDFFCEKGSSEFFEIFKLHFRDRSRSFKYPIPILKICSAHEILLLIGPKFLFE